MYEAKVGLFGYIKTFYSNTRPHNYATLRKWSLQMQDKFRAFIYYILLVAVMYSPVVFFGKTLQPALYQPYGLLNSWPQDYNGRVPVNIFDIDLATPAYYEWPINKFVGNVYLDGDIPLWNPYQGGGVPLAAQYSTKAFFPYQVIENMSPVWTWDYFLLGRMLVAGFFTYLFLSLLGLEFVPAFLGGMLYMFSGAFTWFINLEQFSNSAMMLPVHIYCLERLSRKKTVRELAWTALSFGLVLLAGQPEMALYIIVLGGCYFFFNALTAGPGKPLGKELLRYGFAAGLGFAFAAPLLMPFVEYTIHAYHLHGAGGDIGVVSPTRLYYALQIFTPIEIPLSLKNPESFVAAAPGGVAFPFKGFPDNGIWDALGGYTGLTSLVLFTVASLSVARRKISFKPHLFFFMLFGSVIILKNLGVRPFLWIGLLPFFDQAWSQRWAGPVWVFCLSAVGGIAVQILKGHLAYNSAKKGGYIWPVVVALFAVLSLYSVFIVSAFLALRRFVEPTLRDDIIGSLSHLAKLNPFIGASIYAGIGVTIFILLASVAVLGYYLRNGKGIYGIIPLAGFELWWAMPRGYDYDWILLKLFMIVPALFIVVAFVMERRRLAVAGMVIFAIGAALLDATSQRGFPDRYDPFITPPYIEALKGDSGHGRVMGGHGVLFPNYASAVGIEDIRYINSMSPAAFHEFKNRYLDKEDVYYHSLWFTGSGYRGEGTIEESIVKNLKYYSFLGVKYIILPSGIDLNQTAALIYGHSGERPFFPLFYSDGSVSIYLNEYAAQRAFVVDEVTYADTYKEAQEAISSSDFNVSKKVVLEKRLPVEFHVPGHDAGSAEIVEYDANSVVIKASTDKGGILVLTDTFYPGWKAYVDGEPAEIYRVNGLVRGVFLRDGDHTVEFRYLPASFLAGVALGGISLLTMGLCFIVGKGRSAP